jgi:hypothetical protein
VKTPSGVGKRVGLAPGSAGALDAISI